MISEPKFKRFKLGMRPSDIETVINDCNRLFKAYKNLDKRHNYLLKTKGQSISKFRLRFKRAKKANAKNTKRMIANMFLATSLFSISSYKPVKNAVLFKISLFIRPAFAIRALTDDIVVTKKEKACVWRWFLRMKREGLVETSHRVGKNVFYYLTADGKKELENVEELVRRFKIYELPTKPKGDRMRFKS